MVRLCLPLGPQRNLIRVSETATGSVDLKSRACHGGQPVKLHDIYVETETHQAEYQPHYSYL